MKPVGLRTDAGEARGYRKGNPMTEYQCVLCDYIYDPQQGDPETGIGPGTRFDELPENWCCPTCGAGMEFFKPTS